MTQSYFLSEIMECSTSLEGETKHGLASEVHRVNVSFLFGYSNTNISSLIVTTKRVECIVCFVCKYSAPLFCKGNRIYRINKNGKELFTSRFARTKEK